MFLLLLKLLGGCCPLEPTSLLLLRRRGCALCLRLTLLEFLRDSLAFRWEWWRWVCRSTSAFVFAVATVVIIIVTTTAAEAPLTWEDLKGVWVVGVRLGNRRGVGGDGKSRCLPPTTTVVALGVVLKELVKLGGGTC